MSIVPILRAAQIIAVLLRAGFKIVRQTGSHVRLQHIKDASRLVTVPMHSKDIARSLLSSILRQAKLSVEEFLKILK